MKHSLDALHMSPYLLATAAALVSAVTAMPALRTGIGLRRWYQPLLLSALGILGIAIIGTVIISSPWLALGLAMLALLVGSVLHTLHRTAGHADEEALNFTQALVNVMAADLDLLQALREIVRSSDFNRTCPHATAQARMIVSEVDAGRRLSASVPYVTGGAPAEYRQIWRQIESLARMIEEDRLGLEAQRETLRSFWEILLEVHETNRAMRQDMMQMEMAKWLFLIIVPGLNLYMWRALDGYEAFLRSPLGLITLGIEVAALIAIFVVMSLLQRFPEVQV